MAKIINSRHNAWLNITLLLTGSLTVMAGAIITAALPDIKDHFAYMQHAALLSKLLITLPSLFIAFVAPFAGKLIDKTGRKKALLWSLALYAIGGTSGFYFSNIYLLLFGRAVLGVSVAGIMTINTTLIGDYFIGKKRSVFMGWQGAFMGFGGVLYVSLGGLLADISWRWPFLVYSFSVIMLLMCRQFLHEPLISAKTDQINLMSKNHLRKKQFLLLYITAFLGMLFFYLIPTQIPFLLQQSGVSTNSTIGFSISISIFAGALLSLMYGKIRMYLSFLKIYGLTFLLMGSGYLMVSFFTDITGILSGLIVAGFGTGMLMPNTNLWLISIALPKKRGSMVGFLNLAVYSGQFLSPVFVLPFNQYFSISFSFLLCGFFMVAMSFWFYYQHLKTQKYTD